ncbi:hypothetical protein MXB_3674, partial [Myxobolus squamalis]
MAGVVYIIPNRQPGTSTKPEFIPITGDSEALGMFGYSMSTLNVNNDDYMDVAIMQLHSMDNNCGLLYIYLGNDPINKLYLIFLEKIYRSSTVCTESLGYGFRIFQKSYFNDDDIPDLAITSIFTGEVSLILYYFHICTPRMRKPVSLLFDIIVDPIETTPNFDWKS